MTTPSMQSPPPATTLRAALATPGAFAVIVELGAWHGGLDDPAAARRLALAADLGGDPRIAAISATDNAGGHVRAGALVQAEAIRGRGHDVLVHVACRDRNRAALLGLGWDVVARGFESVLALTGDYPAADGGGRAQAVFDLDSVALLATLRGIRRPGVDGPALHLGAVVDNVKRHEREVMPQYLKLARKVREGARFVISQVGWDARAADELRRFMRRADLGVPALGNAFVLDRGIARAFHAGRVPGCDVTDELLAEVERRAASPDRGRAWFLELAAKQVAVARGLGYAGMYLAGCRDADEVRRVLDLAATFGPDAWTDLAREVTFPLPGAFRMFATDPATGLATDELAPSYAASLTPEARRRARARLPVSYRANRAVHDAVFAPGTTGYRAAAAAYRGIEGAGLGRPLHVLEQAVKRPVFGCRDCGDCSLPELAYQCPESRCAKGLRNGPCGGSRDGACEVPGQSCVWADAYARLKPYGEELTMLDRPPVVLDHALRGTSAWANTFLGRDHATRPRAEGDDPA